MKYWRCRSFLCWESKSYCMLASPTVCCLKSLHKLPSGKQVCNLSRFHELVYAEDADLVWVTETWLTQDIENNELLPSGYNIYRKDRDLRAGGGVLLAVKENSFASSQIAIDLDTDDLEIIAAEICTASKSKHLLCCCYRPPNVDSKCWLDKFSLFLSKAATRYSNMLICGDFNLPKIHWELPEQTTTGADEVEFTELLSDYYLTQVNTKPTRGDNVLDLVITSAPNQVESVAVLDPAQSGVLTDHSAITFLLETSIKAPPKVKRTVYDYKRADFEGLWSALQAVDLSSIIHSEADINLGWLKWKDTFLAAVADFIPTKKIKGRNTPP